MVDGGKPQADPTVVAYLQQRGVTEQRIRRLCAAGELGCRKFGRVWQVNRRALEAWMKHAAR